MSGTPFRIAVEAGPKGKRTVAFARDWPGLNRGAKTEGAALDLLANTYRDRYRPVATRAGMADAFDAMGEPTVTERYVGTGSTDFWGIAFGKPPWETEPIPAEDLERRLTLLQACWAFFDEIAARVSPELRLGPRGGGRNRDGIIRHVLLNEADWASTTVGVKVESDAVLTPDGLRAYRQAYLTAIRAYHAESGAARTGTLVYLIRHSAYHTMDHAWEMEDRDLTTPE